MYMQRMNDASEPGYLQRTLLQGVMKMVEPFMGGSSWRVDCELS